MTWALVLTILIIAIALIFDFTNGFHDAANAIATCVGTHALKPRTALIMAAVCNFVGAFLGQGVAKTIQSITNPPPGYAGLLLVGAALFGAIAWNLTTWYFGLPSSSSHALIGGIVGAALVAGTLIQWSTVWDKVVIPMVTSPVIGLVLAFLLMRLFVKIFQKRNVKRVNEGFRHSQKITSAMLALGHGLQDAQKTMGIIVLALVSMGYASESDGIPAWVVFAAAAAISLGTLIGGKKIMTTLGRRVIHLTPARGFSAELVSSSILYIAAIGFHAPISTTQVITGSILGAGVEKRFKAVRWSVGVRILWAWVLTLPAAALLAAFCYWFVNLFAHL